MCICPLRAYSVGGGVVISAGASTTGTACTFSRRRGSASGNGSTQPAAVTTSLLLSYALPQQDGGEGRLLPRGKKKRPRAVLLAKSARGDDNMDDGTIAAPRLSALGDSVMFATSNERENGLPLALRDIVAADSAVAVRGRPR